MSLRRAYPLTNPETGAHGALARATREELAMLREFVGASPERRAAILEWFEQRTEPPPVHVDDAPEHLDPVGDPHD